MAAHTTVACGASIPWMTKVCENGETLKRWSCSHCFAKPAATGLAGAPDRAGRAWPCAIQRIRSKRLRSRTPFSVFSGFRLDPFFALNITEGASIGSTDR